MAANPNVVDTAKPSLLDKAQACIELSQRLLLEGDNAGSLAAALVAAKHLQLIRLLRQELKPDGR